MKKVIVTGGAGYIGSHTCKLLRENNFLPVTLDNLSNGHKNFVKWGPLEVVDLKNKKKVLKIFKKYNPIAIIHLASLIEAEKSIQFPKKFYKNNVTNTFYLFEIMKILGIKNIIFSSSAAVYNDKQKKFLENGYLKPKTPYGHSKLVVEKKLKELSKLKIINFISLRYFNAAGADKTLKIGEKHKNETHLIPLAIESSYKKKIFSINGGNYKTKDGSAVRDYVHVNDIAKAHVMSLKYLLKNNKSQVFNVGTGKGYTVIQIINILNTLNLKINYLIKKRRKGDPRYLVANINKIKKILKFKPKYSIRDILISSVKYYEKINKIKKS